VVAGEGAAAAVVSAIAFGVFKTGAGAGGVLSQYDTPIDFRRPERRTDVVGFAEAVDLGGSLGVEGGSEGGEADTAPGGGILGVVGTAATGGRGDSVGCGE
jgi:hypothetical protein